MKGTIKSRLRLRIYLRALRLPFISVSVLAFIFGLLVGRSYYFYSFWAGLDNGGLFYPNGDFPRC